MTVFGWTKTQWCVCHAWARQVLHAPVGDDLLAAEDAQASWRLHWSVDPRPSNYVTQADIDWADRIWELASGADERADDSIARPFGRA